ncbi:hypothetical protein [Angustibacter luteus]|uniref:Peptidase C1A papain C-terminal domain-containing protein n=1 Tax=Angustibacter luteus TaxID=658456 RepID=A0ABW1JI76_9ACTN
MTYRTIHTSTDGEHPLGRHVNHDPRSRAYAHLSTGRTLQSVRHTRHVPVFDQGSLGSCTGNALTGALATDPLFGGLPQGTTLDEDKAVEIYSAATKIDPYDGEYPPDDTGSDGLSVAKVAQSLGLISGYRHAFSLADALDALQDGPVITGVEWFAGFDRPSADGTVEISGEVRGGHEIVVDEYDAATGKIGLTNSWGDGWGVDGRFHMTAATWGKLLDRQGDVTILVPATAPAPTPDPTPVPDSATFLNADPVVAARVARAAARRGLSIEEWLLRHLKGYFDR